MSVTSTSLSGVWCYITEEIRNTFDDFNYSFSLEDVENTDWSSTILVTRIASLRSTAVVVKEFPSHSSAFNPNKLDGRSLDRSEKAHRRNKYAAFCQENARHKAFQQQQMYDAAFEKEQERKRQRAKENDVKAQQAKAYAAEAVRCVKAEKALRRQHAASNNDPPSPPSIEPSPFHCPLLDSIIKDAFTKHRFVSKYGDTDDAVKDITIAIDRDVPYLSKTLQRRATTRIDMPSSALSIIGAFYHLSVVPVYAVHTTEDITDDDGSINIDIVNKIALTAFIIVLGGMWYVCKLYDIDPRQFFAKNPPWIAVWFNDLVSEQWDNDKAQWKPNSDYPGHNLHAAASNSAKPLLQNKYRDEFRKLYIQKMGRDKKNDTAINKLFSTQLQIARKIIQNCKATGKKRGDLSSHDPTEVKKYRLSRTCPHCETPVQFIGLRCDYHTKRQDGIVIDQTTGIMTSFNEDTQRANRDQKTGRYVTSLAQRIPQNSPDRQKLLRQINQRNNNLNSSTRCILCEDQENANTTIYSMPNNLASCRECAISRYSIEFFHKDIPISSRRNSRTRRQYWTKYIDSDGTPYQYPHPFDTDSQSARNFPCCLYALSNLTNEEADSVGYAIEQRRASKNARQVEARSVEYERRSRLYQENALQARAVFMSTSDPNANITVWQFMFRDPTLPTDVNATNFRRRMGNAPYSLTHITFTDPRGFQTNRRGPRSGDGLRSLKPNKSFTSTTIMSIPHLTNGEHFNIDNKTWASISLVRAFSFFGRKYRHYYPLKTGNVGYVCFIFKTNPRHVHYQQCICTSPQGVSMVPPPVQMLSGCACKKKGPFVEPDLVARFTCTDDSEDPTSFTWRIISARKGPTQPLDVVDLDLNDPSLTANIWGVYYREVVREVVVLGDSDSDSP